MRNYATVVWVLFVIGISHFGSVNPNTLGLMSGFFVALVALVLLVLFSCCGKYIFLSFSVFFGWLASY